MLESLKKNIQDRVVWLEEQIKSHQAEIIIQKQYLEALETEEKSRRIYYQDICYAVCTQLDRVFGKFTKCGTLEDPCTQTQDLVKKLVDFKLGMIPISFEITWHTYHVKNIFLP